MEDENEEAAGFAFILPAECLVDILSFLPGRDLARYSPFFLELK